MIPQPHRGFTLLIAIILASVSLVVGLALADVAYKQVVLSSTAKNSQIAFYRADSAMECALYWDQQFGYFNDMGGVTITCEGQTIVPTKSAISGGVETNFSIPCAGGQASSVKIYKLTSGSCSASGARNCLYASGYNTCTASDPNRFERGLKVLY